MQGLGFTLVVAWILEAARAERKRKMGRLVL
jgi:hypothetical protein